VSDVVIAIILGVVEGLTEYLPISSTGHLILFGEALHFTGEKAKTFDVVIQLGAILSVLVLYRHRFVALFKGLRQGVSKPRTALNPGMAGLQGILKLALVSAPALSVGFIFRGQIKEHLFAPFPVAIAFAVGALLILIVDRNGKVEGQIEIDQLTCRQSFLIGCVQCLALWPGMSRSASTIIGGMLGGLSRAAAAEFSFLAAVPVLSAAALYDLSKALLIFTTKDLELVAIGFVISFVTALIAIKVFISIVSRWSLRPFAYYRLLVAAIVLTLL
jgi:undecaprenyl-diphosphatase